MMSAKCDCRYRYECDWGNDRDCLVLRGKECEQYRPWDAIHSAVVREEESCE